MTQQEIEKFDEKLKNLINEAKQSKDIKNTSTKDQLIDNQSTRGETLTEADKQKVYAFKKSIFENFRSLFE